MNNIDKNNKMKKGMSMKNQKRYDKGFKLNAVKLYKESGNSCDEVSKKLGIAKSDIATFL
jgi:transposase-like protein